MAETKDYQRAKEWGTGPVYVPYFVDYIRDDEGNIDDQNYRYLGHFHTEEEAVAAIRANQKDDYGTVERYRWDRYSFSDDEYGKVWDASLEQDESYEQREIEPSTT